ncbi:hypothetical protein C1N66_30990 (plasmid) [Bacillus cereus]|uniref:Group-specific protein n=1 Tax=Bacillus cereus TaxID=1396 RepID=A0AB73UT78_BACCE|nr:hypothetical protein [Bacillus cereus]HDR3523495.1 hypothetical protein [Bacillus pacificus]QHV07986.1 hypothetical protein C1N82_32850 [Bacillus cereus]QHV47447.1 hypothetical protein C1N66_30990 [Bacillus cereus]HDR3634052.1 hypothetical protein [Bacillus pacificus]HDR7652988.1 hypothetical protein [Bacillus pacificus]
MYKKIVLGILTTGVVLLGSNSTLAAENENNLPINKLSKTSINSSIEKIDVKNFYSIGVYELSIPVGFPYYLPTKINASGNNSYTYKVVSQTPEVDWEINFSNGEVLCGVEGTITINVYDEFNNLFRVYKITAGGI